MKILLTGYKGFIGSNLLPLLKKYNVVGVDIINGSDIFNDYFENEVKNCDEVIHLAALTNVEDSKKNPKPYYMTNVLGTARIVYLCMKYHKKMIYPSTLHVFNPDASPYADSKLAAESIVQICRQFTPTVILRLYNVFGRGMNNNSGSIINMFLKSPVIEVYGKGDVKRDFIHVKDVVSIIANSIKSKYDGKVVEVGTGIGTSIKKIAQLFSKYRGVDIKYLLNKKQLKWPIADTKILNQLYKKKIKTDLEKDIHELCLS